MEWLNKVVEAAIKRKPDGEIIVESGVSPSGTYHLGTLREVLTAEAIAQEIKHRGRQVRHVHFVDDLDALRKIPAGVPEDFKKYLGQPLADVPAPKGSGNWADYYLADLLSAKKAMRLDMDIVRAGEKYRAGYFVPSIELVLDHVGDVRRVMEEVAGRKLDPHYSPIQVNEEGYLKSRKFLSLDKQAKTVKYEDLQGTAQTVKYDGGDVKLDWRVDWPARWWQGKVDAEPFGRDHATKGGSYDTGAALMKSVFKAEPPLPLPYEFINRSGQTKKMSKSAGETIGLAHLLEVLPAEVIWYFVLRLPADKQLYFDEGEGIVKLIDDFAQLLAKTKATTSEEQLIRLSTQGQPVKTISNIPFSHLVASYQAALRDTDKTLEILSRTEYNDIVARQTELVKNELNFIAQWLEKWAPEELKFSVEESVSRSLEQFKLSDAQKTYLRVLADRIEKAGPDQDGEWFHKTIYDLKDASGLEGKELFSTLYKVLISKDYGPRAGWFLSTLESLRTRDWLLKRLRLEA